MAMFVGRAEEVPDAAGEVAPVRRLTNDPGDDLRTASPATAGSSPYRARGTQRFDAPDIFRMRADGTRETNLTRTPTVMEFDPSWQP